MNCYKGSSYLTCDELSKQGCYNNFDKNCADLTLEIYLDSYVASICKRGSLTTSSHANLSNEETRTYMDLVDLLMLILLFLVNCFMVYYNEKKSLDYDRFNNTIDDYSVVLYGLKPVKDANNLT